MTVTVPDEYALKPAGGRRLATVGNRIGAEGEYAVLVDRDTWLFCNLARRPIICIGSDILGSVPLRSYTFGDEICDVFSPLSQPARGIRIEAMYQCDATGDEQLEWEVIDADTTLSIGTGTFAFSSVTAKASVEFYFVGTVTNVIVQIRCIGTVVSRDVFVYGLNVFELNLTLGELPA
ncbi:MAG: hypothetical protein KUG67_02545 [Proteobacteria bacterium]|nr:hypothetical protein [Pseudomonadota bacterium]